jgi:hypothetical protein
MITSPLIFLTVRIILDKIYKLSKYIFYDKYFLTVKRALYGAMVENIIPPRKGVICLSATKAKMQTRTQNM